MIASGLESVRAWHETWAWVVVISNALVGVWVLAANWLQPLRVKVMWWSVAAAELTVFVQVTLGAIMVGRYDVPLPQFHAFYGFVAIVSVAIIYSYRSQMRHRIYLLYGLGSLFIMGLGIRAMLLQPDADATAARQPIVVASIVFDEPTDAWVSTSGTLVLRSDGDGYVLARYGTEGLVEAHPIDELNVLDDHRVREVGGDAPVVIDGNEYALVDGVWVKGECYACRVPEPEAPTVRDKGDGTWELTVDGARSTVAQPDGWDGTTASVEAADDGTAVIVARTTDDDTVVIDGAARCHIDGARTLVSIAGDDLVLQHVDPGLRDYSTERVARCGG